MEYKKLNISVQMHKVSKFLISAWLHLRVCLFKDHSLWSSEKYISEELGIYMRNRFPAWI